MVKLADLLLLEKFDYYRIDQNNPLPIKEVQARWVTEGDKAYDHDSGVHGYYSIEQIRWVRPGNQLRDEPGSDYYEKLKTHVLNNIATKGAALSDGEPIIIHIGRNGKMKVGEGNHRTHICKNIFDKIEVLLLSYPSAKQKADLLMVKSRLDKLPVRFIFYQEVSYQ